MLNLLTTTDIVMALVLAAIFTWFINRISNAVLVKSSPNLEQILKKCYALFPEEIFQFHGETYRRGMNIRLTTTQNKVIEGEFLGLGNNNMICLMTNRFIVTHTLTGIERVELL